MDKRKENKMGFVPIPKLVMSMSLPAILAMLIQALYNVVDSIFVSRISDTNNDGLTAISLVFPLQMIVIAVFVGLGVGMNALISRKLGEKKQDEAVLVAENGVMIGFIVYAIVAVLGVILARPFYNLFTENQLVIDYATTYTRIVMMFAFGRIIGQAGISIYQGTGEMVKPMISMLIGAILNMILDPIFIFGYFGLPAMGVEGAAIATVVAQIVAMIYVWWHILFGKSLIELKPSQFKPMGSIVKQILLIGIPVALMQGLASIMLGGFNFILKEFGDVSISVMGVYFRLQSMVFMPVFGLSTGTMPIIGYNFGARNKKRLTDAIKFSSVVATCFLTTCFILFQVFAGKLLGLFNPSEEMIAIGIPALKTISFMFPFIGVSIIFSTTFQAFGKAHFSLISSAIRQLLLLLPITKLLSLFGDVTLIWYAFLITEFLGLIIVSLMFRYSYRTSVGHWDDELSIIHSS